MLSSQYSPTLNLLLEILRSYNVDPMPLMRELSIDPELISDHSSRFRLKQVLQLYTKAEQAVPDPSFGLRAAKYWHPSQFGALGFAWMSSSTLRSAMKRLARFSKIVSDGIEITVIETDTEFSLQLNFIEKTATTFRADAAMAVLLAMMQTNAGKSFHPKSTSFAHPEPQDTSPFFALFQCPVKFDASETCFTISADEADQPRSCSNSQLAALHDRLVMDYLASLGDDNLFERVKAAVIDKLTSGNISDAIVADSLSMTERTLQRRLQERNTTFKKLLTEVRQNLADQYIRDSQMSLQEISFLLGFSELSSFSRAFKHWNGVSPKAYRSVHKETALS